MPWRLVGDLVSIAETRQTPLLLQELWSPMLGAARSEAAQAMRELRLRVEQHVGGHGDLHAPDVAVLQRVVLVSFLAHNGWVKSGAGEVRSGVEALDEATHGSTSTRRPRVDEPVDVAARRAVVATTSLRRVAGARRVSEPSAAARETVPSLRRVTRSADGATARPCARRSLSSSSKGASAALATSSPVGGGNGSTRLSAAR